MSSQVAQLWQQFLDRLSAFATNNSAGSIQDFAGLLSQTTLLMPYQPAATWTALIQDMQFPRQLGVLALRLTAGEPYQAGNLLPSSVASTVVLLLQSLSRAGISSSGEQSKGLWNQVEQQMVDSGLVSCVQHLMEATAQQLECCTAAAAAADNSGSSMTAAAAIPAASHATSATAAASEARGGAELGGLCSFQRLQYIASNLLEIQAYLNTMFTSTQDMIDTLDSVQTAAARMTIAGMQHISVISRHQQQQQHWDNDCIWDCCMVLGSTLQFLHPQSKQHRSLFWSGPTSGSGCTPFLSSAAHEELLLLTLQLLQRLQRLRGAANTVNSTASTSATSQVAPESAAVRAAAIDRAEAAGAKVLLSLANIAIYSRPAKFSGLAPAAAAAAAAAAEAAANAEAATTTAATATAAAGGVAAAATTTTTATAAAAAATGAAGDSPLDPCDSLLFAAYPRHARALLAAIEGFVRAQGSSSVHVLGTVSELTVVCCAELDAMPWLGRPSLLERLARGVDAQQQVAIFNVLVTLLKLLATPPFSRTSGLVSQSRVYIASVAVDIFCMVSGNVVALWNFAANHDVGAIASSSSSCCSSSGEQGLCLGGSSSSDTSVELWLLLLGRCCLQWAAELAQMQAEGADWAQHIRQAQQKGLQVAAGSDAVRDTLYWCFAIEKSSPLLLGNAHLVISTLRAPGIRGSSSRLTATGYDMGAVLQGFEAIVACYPDVLEAGSGDVAASNVARLIKALEAVGRACSVFAVPHCCNNPGCSNPAGASELSIVTGKSCKCGGCKIARYCGRGCQKAHWKPHKAP